MIFRAVPLAVVVASVLVCAACPPKPASEQLPPSGLAGSPATGAPLTLPGAGMPVADPSGGTPSTALPPGHPPIPGVTPGAASADTLPPGHPAMPGAGGTAPANLADPGMAGPADGNVVVTGSVQETMDVPEYTYMRLKTASGETWVAVQKTPVAVGDVVTVNQSLVMTDFFSKSLNRKFPQLVMGMLVGAPKKP